MASPRLRLVLLLVALLEVSHRASACGRAGRGCSIFNKCCGGFSCHPFIQKCYHSPRREDEPCVAGHGCGPDLQCEAGSQRCREFGRSGDPCHATRRCAGGFSCQPGVQKCYNNPRQEGQPCSAGFGCANGLHCEAGTQTCRAPGGLNDPCHLTRPCGNGFSCQPGVHKCYDSPRKEGQPCVAGHECASPLNCEAGSQTCRRPGELYDPCHLTRPCKGGLTCQPGVHKCYHSPRRVGEPCSAGFECGRGFYCIPVLQRCGIKKFDTKNANACIYLYDSVYAKSARDTKRAMTYGTAVSHQIGVAASIEFGTAYGPNGEYGCYHTTCSGVVTDVGAGIAVSVGSLNDWASVPGEAVVTSGGASFPGLEIGASLGAILSTDVPPKPLGGFFSVGVGIGIVPANLGSTKCNTVLDSLGRDGKMDSGETATAEQLGN